MTTYVIYEKGDDFSSKTIENIKGYLNKKLYYKKYKIKFYFMLKNNLCPDIFLIISNNIEFIRKKTNYLAPKNKIIIVTNIIKYNDISYLFNITNNVIYSNANIEKIILKIVTVYYKNNLTFKL